MAEQFAEVVFPIPLRQVFTYRLPPALESLAQVGMRCFAPFGHRQTVGFITGIIPRAPAHVKNLKSLDSLLDSEALLTPDLQKLGKWIADYYYCSEGEALFAILPMGFVKTKRFLVLTPEGLQNKEKVLAVLEKAGPMRKVSWETLGEGTVLLSPRTSGLTKLLKKEGLAALKLEGSVASEETGLKKGYEDLEKGPPLHNQQQVALDAIEKNLNLDTFHTFLLQGVTGSGKTEVYLRAISTVLKKGQQAIVLIPEIALTPQTVDRFTRRFGDQVAVFHSRLGPTEKIRHWRRMASGEAKVAVGARSALFAPAKNLGLIVVDEEHDSSYKQDKAPRYHARDAAIMRAQICKATAILGSATPSLESVQNARLGKYTLLSMPERVNRKALPRVKVVNLREEWTVRGEERPILSMALEEALRENLERHEQSMLFLNRRGFNTVTLCLKCGAQVHCPNCSIPVTSHKGPKGVFLLCHYCDWQGPPPETCPTCKDGAVQQVGLGTEKVEEELRSKFPQARIARMDLDTTREKGSHEKILDSFRRHEIDLLLGTQMIAKGHDFPGVTLVGIIGADTGLALPDFRSSERVFQLLVQVSGRAGRAEKEGTIYLQTFNPDHPSIQAAVHHDTEAFWKGELELRKDLGYPPFSRLGLLVYQHKDEKRSSRAAEDAAAYLKREARSFGVEVRGPAPAGIFKLRDQYRFQILLKAEKPTGIRQLIQSLDSKFETPTGVSRAVDLDPQSML